MRWLRGKAGARTGVLLATAVGATAIWLIIEAMVAPDFEGSRPAL